MTHVRAIFCVLVLLAGLGTRALAHQPVTIVLLEKAVATRQNVRVRDIAVVSGGSEALRSRIESLDIEDLPADGHIKVCSRMQIQYRLRLAGIPAPLFTIEGAEEVSILPKRQSISADRIFSAAKEEACRRLSWSKEDLSIRLAQPITIAMPTVADDEVVAIHAEPNRSDVTLGRVQMNVTIRISGQKRLVMAIYLEIQAIQDVAVARRRIARGEVVTADCIFRERRAGAAGNLAPERPDALIGKRANRDLAPGQVLLASDVQRSVEEPNKPLVQAGQHVRLVAHLGAIDVIALGEALQSGTSGQYIRVRNNESKKIITGRVTGLKTVEIDFGKP